MATTQATNTRKFTDLSQHVLLQALTDNGQSVSSLLIDDSTHELTVITHEHHEIHEGSTFRYYDSVTLGSAASQDYLITTPNSSVEPHLTFNVDGTAVTSFFLYEATDKTGTTLQSPFNANRRSGNTPKVTVHKSVSGGTTDGTLLIKYAGGTSTNQSKSSGANDFNKELLLAANTKYILRITSGAAGNLCNVELNWYEHTSLAL